MLVNIHKFVLTSLLNAFQSTYRLFSIKIQLGYKLDTQRTLVSTFEI